MTLQFQPPSLFLSVTVLHFAAVSPFILFVRRYSRFIKFSEPTEFLQDHSVFVINDQSLFYLLRTISADTSPAADS